ncbi:MAG: serine/threonine-protein kinase PknK, partial [Deltaproteobacteria bacterium]|nr:serine/threonine-protein kinase PknK [Deltaproteobacteria bacterium]
LLPSRQLNLKEILNLCIRITEILGNIHKHNIIHKDINPSNIIWNKDDDNIQIIDFDLATEHPREITSMKNPNVLEGTLPYISPEQTGRMNRSLDYRTDYYSLGITFYWMLTGKLPFESTDPLELVHSHIAIEPETPHEINKKIPDTISCIVMKLMAKNAEERYHSCFGLKADLKRCQHELLNTGIIDSFKLGSFDVSDKFEISQKIYGREKEIPTLLSSFERIRQGKAEIMLVSGFPGIGKSVLINEIQKHVVKYNGYFISGKFEKLKKNVPLYGIIQAFNGFVEQVLAEGFDKINQWKEKILTELGSNGKIITDIIPSLELIIGKQPEVTLLGPVETRNRYNLFIGKFIGILSNKEHPLVIFLDDLQWADMASIHFLEFCTSDIEKKHLLLIGSYRDNEVSESHPLHLSLAKIKISGIIVNDIFLGPLATHEISQLLSDTLNRPVDETRPLTELLIQKTGGNPFFINEFLKSLYKLFLISFSHKSGWSWDMTGIEQMQVTDNVVELMADKISELPGNSRKVIKLGACIGNNFNLATMLSLSGKSKKETIQALKIIIQEGMLNFVDDTYNFSHDRVQEAAYSLIPDKGKKRHHFHIGNLALKRSGDNLSENLFYIVNQLNSGKDLFNEKYERNRLSELNLMAGKKAMASNAYTAASNYLRVGIGLLNQNCWKEKYDLTLELYQEATLAAQLSAEYKAMEKLSEKVIHNANSILDKVKIYETNISACIARNQLLEGIEIGLSILKKLGIRIPAKPGKMHIIYELIKLKITLIGKPIENLIDIPEMADPYKFATMKILAAIGTLAYQAAPELLPIITFIAISLSIKYGNNFFSPYSYAGFGIIQCGIFKNIGEGYKWGKLALDVIKRYDFKDTESRVNVVTWYLINHWIIPIRDCMKPLLEAYKIGLETGDLEWAALSAGTYSVDVILSGIELELAEKEVRNYMYAIEKLNQNTTFYYQLIYHQYILNLLGKSGEPCKLIGSSYDTNKMLSVHENANDFSAFFYLYLYT